MNDTSHDTSHDTSPDTADVPGDVSGRPDPRPGFARTATQLGETIRRVGDDDLARLTSCDGWDVQTLLAHIVGVANRVAALGRGSIETGELPVPDRVARAEWVPMWIGAAADALDVWADDDLLTTMVSPPFGTMPGAVALGIYTTELTVHHWDLATAIGAPVEWDDRLIVGALAGMMVALPADGRGDGIPFSSVVDVAPDAAPIDRLVAYTGRDPRT
ncbi:MAG: TIGR03086 family metal-binding protein [Ilumatobacteraceae bacterium]